MKLPKNITFDYFLSSKIILIAFLYNFEPHFRLKILVLKHSKDACAGFFGISPSFRVHPPFYDGNGRTGRYLLALYLDESLSIPTVLSLSRTIAKNKTPIMLRFLLSKTRLTMEK